MRQYTVKNAIIADFIEKDGMKMQFSPFQALSGYGAAIEETARLTGEKAELTEEEKAALDEKLRLLADTGREAVFTYCLPDERKSGSTYVTIEGKNKRIDLLKGCIVLMDGTAIPIEDILDVTEKTSTNNLGESLWTE